MSWFNYNGAWVQVKNGGPGDVARLLNLAKKDLDNLKAMTPGLEIKHFRRPGMWRITSIFGRDVIEMEAREEVQRKEKRIIYTPNLKYVPAFHTVDVNGNWLGITICTSGKWGPPYKFISCKSDKIYPFEYGQWNTELGATPPEDYRERTITTVYPGSVRYMEIPADHDYKAMMTTQDAVITSGGGTTLRNYEYRTSLITDWQFHDDDYASWKSSAPYVDHWYALFDEFTYHEDPESPWDGDVFSSDTYSGESPIFSSSWTTFKEINEAFVGVYAYGLNNVSSSEYHWYPDEGLPTSGETDATTASDFVNVFGKEYLLKVVNSTPVHISDPISIGATYTNSTDFLVKVNPRIYRTDSDNKWALFSLYRADGLKWEYLCFHGDVKQYNDEAAQYEWVSGNLHMLPITVNNQQAYGNGEFSLVKIFEPEAVEHDLG